MTKQIKFILNQEQKQELLKVKKQSQSSIIRDRAHAVLLRSQGKKIHEIANILFRSQTFVKESIKSYQQEGIIKLQKHNKGGNSKKLSQEQKDNLKQLLEKEPLNYGFNQSFWSIDLLKIFVKKQFGLIYQSNQSYYDLFRYCGFSFKKPQTKDARQDPVKVEQFKDALKKTYKSTKIRLSW